MAKLSNNDFIYKQIVDICNMTAKNVLGYKSRNITKGEAEENIIKAIKKSSTKIYNRTKGKR